MGQVVKGPLEDFAKLDSYKPPDPGDPFYFERIEESISRNQNEKYVCLTSHFTFIERLHMLHGFENTMVDFYYEPKKVERVLDMILDYKLGQIDEVHRRFGDRVQGVFLTDDWGTQQGPFISMELFDDFFLPRYKALVSRYHEYGYHFILHSCGRINDLVERFIDAGVDMMNMQQPRAYGIAEIGERYCGRIAFLATADIQSTLPTGDKEAIRDEVYEICDEWGTEDGGIVVFNYGDGEAIAVDDAMSAVMFDAFMDRMYPAASAR
jgi:uroporphyrinogen decarboxylase